MVSFSTAPEWKINVNTKSIKLANEETPDYSNLGSDRSRVRGERSKVGGSITKTVLAICPRKKKASSY